MRRPQVYFSRRVCSQQAFCSVILKQISRNAYKFFFESNSNSIGTVTILNNVCYRSCNVLTSFKEQKLSKNILITAFKLADLLRMITQQESTVRYRMSLQQIFFVPVSCCFFSKLGYKYSNLFCNLKIKLRNITPC